MFNPLVTGYPPVCSRFLGMLKSDSTEETFLQDFSVILKRMLRNYGKILKKCFLIAGGDDDDGGGDDDGG